MTGLTGDKRRRYLYGDCAVLAMAVSYRTGWPVVQIIPLDENGEWTGVRHALVQMPGGLLLDAQGAHEGWLCDQDVADEDKCTDPHYADIVEPINRAAWNLDDPSVEAEWRDPGVLADADELLAAIA